MLTRIKRETCLLEYPKFPQANYSKETFFFPKSVAGYTLTLHSASAKGHIKRMAQQLAELVRQMGYDSLVILGEEKTPWLYQDNDYKPVKAALNYLAGNKVGKRFNGALLVTLPELPAFLVHLCWLSRCNAALPVFYFMDKEQNIIGNICQYANLHIYTANTRTDKLLKAKVPALGFEYIPGGKCTNPFGKTGAITGRQTMVR